MESTPYKIPLFDLDIGEEELQAVQEVLRSKWLTMGDVTSRFEEAFALFLDVPYCFAVSSGTAALHLAVLALDIEPGDEVVCPSLTFVATANAILYAGGIPVFADIKGKHDLNISPTSIESRITERAKAVMVVHYGGFPCDMEEIIDIASRHRLKVIEDAAHAPGAGYVWKGEEGKITEVRKVGGIGDIGCFSFFSNKNLSTGEGGMVVTKDEKIANRLKILRSHGMTSLTLDRYRGHASSYDVTDLGYNYRIDEMKSALGIVQLKKLPEKNERRRILVELYRKQLQKVDGVEVPFEGFTHRSTHHILPVLLREDSARQDFTDALRTKGIQTSIHYPPIHKFTYYQRSFGARIDKLPWTEYVGDHEITLPLYPSMKEEEVNYVVRCIHDLLKK